MSKNIVLKSMLLLPMSFFIIGCANTSEPQPSSIDNRGKTTLGVVQKSIRKGMSSAEVVEVLGSPNMVTQDEDSNEVWVYDKMSTEVRSSGSQSGVWFIIAAGSESSSSASRSQKTLTIVIKFNSRQKVNKFSYRSSSF